MHHAFVLSELHDEPAPPPWIDHIHTTAGGGLCCGAAKTLSGQLHAWALTLGTLLAVFTVVSRIVWLLRLREFSASREFRH
jgi:hypothetical protein